MEFMTFCTGGLGPLFVTGIILLLRRFNVKSLPIYNLTDYNLG